MPGKDPWQKILALDADGSSQKDLGMMASRGTSITAKLSAKILHLAMHCCQTVRCETLCPFETRFESC